MLKLIIILKILLGLSMMIDMTKAYQVLKTDKSEACFYMLVCILQLILFLSLK